jgi:CelD/BcsL family acetyltransferase involved in cellulose biosynthesis
MRTTRTTPVTEAVDPRFDDRWMELAASAQGGVFGSPPWISALVNTYGFPLSAHIGTDAHGRPTSGLACAEVRDVRSARLISLPFCDYLDPAIDSSEEWDALVAPYLDRGLPMQLRVCNSTIARTDPRFEHANELAWHVTNLNGDDDEILAGFQPQARQNIRGARRRGVTVRFGNSLDDVRAFHSFHRRTRKCKYRMLAQPITFFENIWRSFAPRDGVIVGFASHDGEVVAASLYLVWGDTFYYKFGASIAERLSVRPNELLSFESMRLARDRGCRTYDWGVSDLDQPGLVAYKRKFASREGRVTVLRHTPKGYCASPTDDDVRSLLSEVTELLTRDDVPDEVTHRAGEVLYRYFC